MAGSNVASSGGGGDINHKNRMSRALGVETTRFVGVGLIVSGSVMFFLQMVCTILVLRASLSYRGAHTAGTGIWCGIVVVICGILGCCAAKYKTNAFVISFLVFNVLCTVLFAPIIIGTAAGDISSTSFCKYERYDYETEGSVYNCDYKTAILIPTWLLLIDALFIFGISIVGLVTNSVALKKGRGCCCGCCNESHIQPPVVIYIPTNEMPGVVGQPMQFVALSGQVDPIHPQSPAYHVLSTQQPFRSSAAGAAAAAATDSTVPASTTGATSEPPPYTEKMQG